jgi:hypothetical protein
MDPRRREIETLEAEIARLEQQLNGECVAIGRQIAGLDRSPLRSGELLKYLASIDTLNASVETYRRDIARIRETVRKIDDLRKAADEADRKAKELAAEVDGRLVDLGAGCWSVYQRLAGREPYRSIFEEVARLDLEAERLAKDLKQLEAEESGGWFDKLKVYGRKLSKRSAVSKVEKQKLAAFAEAGAKLAASDFSRHATGDLLLVFDFVAEKRRGIEALGGDAKRERDEAARLEKALAALGIGEDVEERVKDFEKRIADVLRELDVMYCWAGQLFLEKDLRGEIADTALSARYEVARGLRTTMVRKREAIHRRRAEMEVEELQKKEKSLKSRRKQLEDDLRVRERQIAVVDLEISAAQRRMDELKRVLAGEAPYVEAPPLPPPPDFYAPKTSGPP